MAVNRNPNHIPKKSYFAVSPQVLRATMAKHGVPDELVGPITNSLNSIFGKFAADERLNYDVIEKHFGNDHDARPGTLVIASTDSSALSQAGADVVIPGIDSGGDTTGAIQNKIAEIAAASVLSNVGTVVFTEGNFQFATGLIFPEDTHVKGFGNRSTKIWGTTDGTPAFHFNGYDGSVEDCLLYAHEVAIRVWPTAFGNLLFRNNLFQSCTVGIDAENQGASAGLGFYDLGIIYNKFIGCGSNADGAIDLVMSGSNGISHLLIQGNRFDYNDDVTKYDLKIDPGSQEHELAVINGNVFTNKILVKDINSVAITGNVTKAELACTSITNLAVVGNVVGSYVETTCTTVRRSANIGITDA